MFIIAVYVAFIKFICENVKTLAEFAVLTRCI